MQAMLASRLAEVANSFSGRVGYAIRNLNTSAEVTRNADDSFPTASAIKLPLLTALHAFIEDGHASWDDTVTITRDAVPGGSGILQHLDFPKTVSLRDAAWLMICVSDNLATNIVLEAMGLERANRLLHDVIGPGMDVKRYFGFDPDAPAPAGSLAQATPRALLDYLGALADHRLPGSVETLATAANQFYRTSIPRYLPFEPYSSSGLRVYNKTGGLPGIHTDVAIISDGEVSVAMAIMTDGSTDLSFAVDNEGQRCIATIALDVYQSWMGGAP